MTTWTLDNLKQNAGKHYFKFINFLMFQSVWMMSVIGQERFILVSLSLIAAHFALSPSRASDLKAMVAIAAIGITLDYLLMVGGIFVFKQGVFPLWLVVLWLAFALSLNHAMKWLSSMRLGLQILLGAVGGASSYFGGYFLGAVKWGYSPWICLAVLLAVWAMATPIYCFFQRYFNSDEQPKQYED